MYPELPKTLTETEYLVKTRLPSKWAKVKIYSQEGITLGEKDVLLHFFHVETQNKIYELKTKTNGLYEGDKIKVNFQNGEYQVKKVNQ